MQELSKLLEAGYEVSFIKDEAGYVASVHSVDSDTHAYYHTAIADTAGEALWAASPLHAEDDPYPGTLEDLVRALVPQVTALVQREIIVEEVYAAGQRAARSAPVPLTSGD